MTRIEMTAWATKRVGLSHAQAAELSTAGLVEVAAEPNSSEWRLKSESRIGIAVGDGWELRVHPKIDVSQLFFLLAYARDPHGWKTTTAGFEFEPELLDAVCNAFATHAARAVEQGVLRGYVSVDDALTTVRGRIRFSETVGRRGSFPLPIDVSYDEFTSNVLENRLLKTAATVLLRIRRVPPAARQRLLRLRANLEGVELLNRPYDARTPAITRLNRRYEPAMRLAEIVIAGSSISPQAGQIKGTAFAFDMNDVFEDFLTTALAEALEPRGGEVKRHVTTMFDVNSEIRMEPDITWWRGERCRAVVDAKYKSLLDASVRNADAYQMLAYCKALRLQHGFLVYAQDKSSVAARNYTVRNSDCEIRVRAVDLGQPPQQLLDAIAQISEELRQSAPAAAAAAA